MFQNLPFVSTLKIDDFEFTKFTGKHLCWSLFLNRFRSSRSQMFFRIVVLRKIVVQNSLQESGPRKAPMPEAFLIKLQALIATTLIKRDS